VPEELKGIDVIEHLNEPLPLDTRFTDDSGNPVVLRDYFKGEKPVLLQLGYNKCPMLCNLVLNGAFDGLKGVDWLPGKEFEIVSVSVDPTETAALAKAKKESYLARVRTSASISSPAARSCRSRWRTPSASPSAGRTTATTRTPLCSCSARPMAA
jgi:hypothetical protein